MGYKVRLYLTTQNERENNVFPSINTFSCDWLDGIHADPSTAEETEVGESLSLRLTCFTQQAPGHPGLQRDAPSQKQNNNNKNKPKTA